MSALLTVSGIAELALRRIGAYSINDTAADPAELDETVRWIDLVVAQLCGTERLMHLIPATLSGSLEADVASYKLADLFGASVPADGILAPISAWVRDTADDDDNEVTLVLRSEYENKADKTSSGTPEIAFIDRLTNDAMLYVYPVPTSAQVFRLTVQTFAPDFTEGTPNGAGNLAHGFAAHWQRWLILAAAAEIGSGPVRRLPIQEINDIRQQAGIAEARLLAYANREKISPKRQRTRAFGA